MQAQVKRHIRSGQTYSHLIPNCTHRDTVIVGSGKARLEDTLKLMQTLIKETQSDTTLLAKKLKGHSLAATCKNIWQFVYSHIQYKMDKTGVEQVRRPSRTWADRKTGVDCDCYTVFISSLLSNLGIAHKMRITKYGGKPHFQHIYPIVPNGHKHITIDCVTDQFNYEVPYSEKRDIGLSHNIRNQAIGHLSGVDSNAVSLDALQQPRLPLWSMPYTNRDQPQYCLPLIQTPSPKTETRLATMMSPMRFEETSPYQRVQNNDGLKLWDLFMLSAIPLIAGIGVWKLVGDPTQKSKQKKTGKTKKASK